MKFVFPALFCLCVIVQLKCKFITRSMTTNAIILRGTYNECTQRMLFCFFELACMSVDDQEIVGLIPTGSGSILRWRLIMGWSGGVKVLCISRHRGVQLILAYSWARPAILVAGKGRGGMFLFLLFLHFHSCSSFFPVPLFHLFYFLLYLFFSLSLGDDTK